MPSIDDFNARARGTLSDLLGIEFVSVERGQVAARLQVRPNLLTPHGYLHGGTVVALADSACGFGAMASLPEGAQSFTTVELKTNFLGTARAGAVVCRARLVHGGRTTQVWDAEVVNEATGRTIALFRCTQMLLYERPAGQQNS
ncbi:MAG TPA: PaaI family thioesterase [Roseiflexaceae bacterium]|jgi:uncharacterized protein (TIGR00369 family)|nr:PaaI family thioesterase [Roseiflexaceae bacterium]